MWHFSRLDYWFPNRNRRRPPRYTELDGICEIRFWFYVYVFGTARNFSGAQIEDDVPEEVKKRRLTEVITLQREHSAYHTQKMVGKTVEVLIEGESRKSDKNWSGRTPQNTDAVFPKENYKPGDFVNVQITDCTTATLQGVAVGYSENHY